MMSTRKKDKIVAIASDHSGFILKSHLIDELASYYPLWDLGHHSESSVDYVDYGYELAQIISQDQKSVSFGILICGSGIGMSIAANRFFPVRAALCCSEEQARLAREHNNANVLVLSSRLVDLSTNLNISKVFLSTSFSNEARHQRRVTKLSDLSMISNQTK